jgi:predicted alpha/beta superfamily hydrolase
MSRAQDYTRQLTDQQLASLNSMNQQFLGQQQQVGNLLLPQYQSILNNPGLSPADKAAVTGQSQGALASAFDALQQSAQNRLARTRNYAGFGDLTDELARQK